MQSALAQVLMRMVAAEPAGDGADPERCPLCRCGSFARKGRDKDGSQRWLCKGCGRTFGRKTLRVIAQSKLGEETWTAYAEGMADGLSLRELVSREALSGGYEATVRGIFAEPRFQLEYREARGWSAT